MGSMSAGGGRDWREGGGPSVRRFVVVVAPHRPSNDRIGRRSVGRSGRGCVFSYFFGGDGGRRGGGEGRGRRRANAARCMVGAISHNRKFTPPPPDVENDDDDDDAHGGNHLAIATATEGRDDHERA